MKLQQVSENATQNLFSSYSQEVELCHVEVLYQCFASPVKIEECFLLGEAVRGFPNFRSRLGLYTTWKPIAYPCDYVSSISHAFNARVLLWRVKSVSNLCFDLFIFPGHCQLVLCLIQSNARISDDDQQKAELINNM